MAQPPHVPKWRQAGSTRSGEGLLTQSSAPRSRSTVAVTSSPGSENGTNTGPRSVSAMPSPCAPSRAMVNLRAHRSFVPASRNSRLPSPPSIGDGQRPSARQPGSASSQAAQFFGDAPANAGSRSRPPLPIAARPASNCGLTSRIALAPGAASSSAGGRASRSEMKLTSQTMKSGGARADGLW